MATADTQSATPSPVETDGSPLTVPGGNPTSVSLRDSANQFDQTNSINYPTTWTLETGWNWLISHFRMPPQDGHWWDWINPLNWINLGGIRRQYFGGEDKAQTALTQYGQTITDVTRQLETEGIHVDPALLRAVLHAETKYNPDIFGIGFTTAPMNVNYDVWAPLLRQHGITEASQLHDPATNIRAAAIILAQLDQRLVHTPGETPEMRAARIASLYGNTGTAIQSGILPYGAMVAQYYTEEVGNMTARRPIREAEAAPSPAPTPDLSRTPERAVG